MSVRTARPRSGTLHAAGCGGSPSPTPATRDAGRTSIPRSASLTFPTSPPQYDANRPDGTLRRAINAARILRERCLACGKPILPWEQQMRIHGTTLHHTCATYHPRTRS